MFLRYVTLLFVALSHVANIYFKTCFKKELPSKVYIRVSHIPGVFQKMIFESSTLYHIMPFAKIIGPVEKKMSKS